ncbi:MAG: hypothetical protein DMG07_12050 [Acidobacteria bacterium]|nr:MAG: hypothetical protein DMG07_12050 [Acidobacteriota bacterium]
MTLIAHKPRSKPRVRAFLALALAAAGVAANSCGPSRSELPWTRSLAEARGKAAAGGLLIIVDLFTDWCGWCREMDRNTWANPAVLAKGRSYVFLKLNAETDPDGMELQKKFGVQSYPMVLLLDSSGAEFERLEGYLPAERFLERLKLALEDPDSLGNLRARAHDEPANLEVRLRLGKLLFKRLALEGRARSSRLSSPPTLKTGRAAPIPRSSTWRSARRASGRPTALSGPWTGCGRVIPTVRSCPMRSCFPERSCCG